MNNFQAHIGIKGVVSDRLTGEPISGAIVWVWNGTDNSPIKHSVTTCMGYVTISKIFIKFS